MESFFIVIGLLLFGLGMLVRMFVPREVWTKVLSGIISDGLRGIWHFLFGPRKVSIVPGKKAKRKKKKREL